MKNIEGKMVFSTKNLETIVLVQSVFNVNAMLVILIVTIAILGKKNSLDDRHRLNLQMWRSLKKTLLVIVRTQLF